MPEPTDRHFVDASVKIPHRGPDGTYQSQRLRDESPRPEEPADNEAGEDRLHLGYTAVPRVYRIVLDQHRRAERKQDLHED